MNRELTAFCNGEGGCNCKFTVDYKMDNLSPDIEHTYFDCPECGLRYSCFYTDAQVRHMQAQIKDILQQMAAGKIDKGRLKKVKSLQERIKKAMNLLKDQHRDDKRPQNT